MINALETIMREAGEIIFSLSSSKTLNVQEKKDSSPVTAADIECGNFLTKKLKKIIDIPVISEESPVDYEIRKKWKRFWLVDPLDGTKEFINGHDDFSICVALVEENRPVLGAIYAPKLQEFYIGGDKYDFRYKGPQILSEGDKNETTIAASRFHNSPATDLYTKYHNMKTPIIIGSAIKFGRLALGQFSLYPRFQGSWEWDIAAGHAILNSVGGKIIDLITLAPPLYNKKILKNNFFIASGLDYS